MTMPKQPTEPTVAVVVPLRTLAESGEAPVVRRRPGRPRRVERGPTVDEAEYHRVVSEQADRFIDADPVLIASQRENSTALVSAAMVETARESAALLFERERAQSQGKLETAVVASRRVDALVRLAGLVVERQRLRLLDPEPDPRTVMKLKTIFFGLVSEAVEEIMPAEVSDSFMSKLNAKLAASAPTATPATSGTTP